VCQIYSLTNAVSLLSQRFHPTYTLAEPWNVTPDVSAAQYSNAAFSSQRIIFYTIYIPEKKGCVSLYTINDGEETFINVRWTAPSARTKYEEGLCIFPARSRQ
jgi:hypothetical protein